MRVGFVLAPYGSNLPESPVTTLAVTPVGATGPFGGQALTAGTYGRGVWQTSLATAGTGVTGATVAPASLAFTGQTVGTSSTTQRITVQNLGLATLNVAVVTITGTNAADFVENTNCIGTSLIKFGSCYVNVSFAPTAIGARAATLVLEANVAGGELLVPLSGTGLSSGSLTLTPASMTFAQQQVGTVSPTQAFSLQNIGGSSVSLTSETASLPFKKVASSCGATLAANTACSITVAFAPTQSGPASGTFTVVDALGTTTAQLSGTAASGPTDTLSTTALNFPSTVLGQSSQPMAITITNSGGLPLTSIGTSVSGPGNVFTLVNNCGSVLAANSSCAITVTFTPTVATRQTASLVISDLIQQQTVSLAGTGLTPPAIALNLSAISFGSQEEGFASTPRLLTITNSGGSPLAQPSFSISGPASQSFTVGTTTCGVFVPPNGSCTVQIIFTPQANGAMAATFTVSTSSTGVASVSAALSGTGLTPPILQLSPVSFNFGPVSLGFSSATSTVQITNVGQIVMALPTSAVVGSNAADFQLSAPTDIPGCTGTLNPNATCNIQVTFSPSIVGPESALLTVTASNAVPTTASVSMSGTGLPTVILETDPTELSFPATSVGSASPGETIAISNIGRQQANLVWPPTLAGPYQLVPSLTTCGTTLPASAFCTVGINFSPTVSGDEPGLLTIQASNLGVSPLAIPLDGSGIAVGGIQPSPTQMTFGSVLVGSPSATQTLTVTNSGQAEVDGLQFAIQGDFTLIANQCAATLPPPTCTAGVCIPSSCSTGLVFTPTSTGIRTGTLTIGSTSTNVLPAEVGLTGNGIPSGSLTILPTVVSFGTVTVGQSSPSQTVTVSNASGPGATVLAGVTLVVGGSGDYTISNNTCGTQIAIGAACTFAVTFSPTQPGTRLGSVTVESTNPGYTPVVAGLNGTGLSAAALTISPAILSFGQVAVGTNSPSQQLTISNPGTGTLMGLIIATASPFSVGSGTCGSFLLAGTNCTVPVIFAPFASGSQNGVITFSSTSLGVSPVQVTVTGSGALPASLLVSPATVSFPATTVGAKSVPQTVTISNPGSYPLAGLGVGATGDFAITTNGCSRTLNAGASCSVSLTFSPTVAGGRSGFLTATSTTAGVANASASLSGTGLGPALLTVAPSQLTFSTTLVGQSSTTQTVTVSNTGQSGIPDLKPSILGQGFILDPARTTCTAALSAGASCIVGVYFQPLAGSTTPIAGSLTLSTAIGAASGTAPASVALSGTGALPPGIVTSPLPSVPLQFGIVGVGQPAKTLQVTVTNSGGLSSLTGLQVAVDTTATANGFKLGSNLCGSSSATGTLSPGASCSVTIAFSPANIGTLTGVLSISASSSGVKPVSLNLTGSGFNFQLSVVSSATMSVVPGQTAYYNLSVTPQGLPAGATATFDFQCGTLPANALCLFNPSQLVNLTAPGNVIVAIGTGGPTAPAIRRPNSTSLGTSREYNSSDPRYIHPGWRGTVLMAGVLLGFPLIWWSRKLGDKSADAPAQTSSAANPRKACRAGILIFAVALSCFLGGLTSCVQAGGSGGLIHTTGGTPPGSYQVIVTVTSVSTGVSQSTKPPEAPTLTLVVN